jgi:hypothetical protein
MTQVHFDSEAQLGGDGSRARPYRGPADLPVPYTLAPGTDYRFRCGRRWNFAASLRSPKFAKAPITVGSYGAGPRPLIECYRMLARDECVEVEMRRGSGEITTTPAAGTGLWRVPATFLGLYGGSVWGVARDVTGAISGTASALQAPREYTAATTDGGQYRVVWAERNPVDAYGGLFASAMSHAAHKTADTNRCIYALQAYHGFHVDGLEFAHCFGATYLTAGNPLPEYALQRGNSVTDCLVRHAFTGFCWGGGDSVAFGGKGFADLMCADNEGSNLGKSFIDIAYSSASVRLDDARIVRNACSGFGRAVSTGGIYIARCYTPGARVLVERNTMTGGAAGNVWPHDGHAIYQERGAQNIEFRRNHVSDCQRAYIANASGPDVLFTGNIAVAPRGLADGDSKAFTGSQPTTDSEVAWRSNIAVGYRRFLAAPQGGVLGRYTVEANVSRCELESGGVNSATNTNALRVGGHDPAHLIVRGNAFWGHDAQVFDGETWNDSPVVVDRIDDDPADMIARLPHAAVPHYARNLGETP